MFFDINNKNSAFESNKISDIRERNRFDFYFSKFDKTSKSVIEKWKQTFSLPVQISSNPRHCQSNFNANVGTSQDKRALTFMHLYHLGKTCRHVFTLVHLGHGGDSICTLTSWV